MHQKLSAVKFFENFAGKHLCFNLVFNEDTGWKNLQNLQENTCVVVSFLITLQAGVAIAPSNFWYTCIFSTASFITKSKVFATFTQSDLTQVQQLLALRQYHIWCWELGWSFGKKLETKQHRMFFWNCQSI